MQYIVLDLEWNQATSNKSSVFLTLPFRLRGEIIQIGAVKLSPGVGPGEEFKCDVKPVYFKKMHYKVKMLTGFDGERLRNGRPFAQAIEEFLDWCGEDPVFLTWGFDDKGIMEQNLMLHDLDIDWLDNWANLQLIYNFQTEGDRPQVALSTAMETCGIEQTRIAHDALGDAYNTALIASKLDLPDGLEHYDQLLKDLHKLPRTDYGDRPVPIEHESGMEYPNIETAFADEKLTSVMCPECGKKMISGNWINQGGRRYMTLRTCPEHGCCLLRLKFKKTDYRNYVVSRLVYVADESVQNRFKDKAGGSPNPRTYQRRKDYKKLANKSYKGSGSKSPAANTK